MAETQFGTNDNLTVKTWERKLFQEALKATWFNKFIGTGSDSLCQKLTNLEKGPGDRIRVGLRMQLTGAGIQGQATQEGNEESLTTYSDDLVVDYLKHAVRMDNSISKQRVAFDIREEMMAGLRDWWADRFDTSFFNQLCGNTGQADTRYTGNQATIAPSAARLICSSVGGGDTTEASLSATTTFSFNFADIDRAVAIAKTAAVPIRPIMVNGNAHYVCFIHPYSVYQLRRNTATNNFMDIARQALAGNVAAGKAAIYDGALGVYNNVILHEAIRIPIITGTPASGAAAAFRRNVFCGAQALALGFGQTSGINDNAGWVEKKFDYDDSLGVKAGKIFGIKKTVFNSVDFATIAISSYAPTV